MGGAFVLGGKAFVLGGRAFVLGGRAFVLGGRAFVLGGRGIRLTGCLPCEPVGGDFSSVAMVFYCRMECWMLAMV